VDGAAAACEDAVMRILYGVVGEGMGHATRSRVVLDHLLARGHEVRVVVSGRAHAFLLRVFAERPGIAFEEIHGLHYAFDGDAIDRSETLRQNVAEAPRGLLHNLDISRRIGRDFEPQVVISDFESFAYFYAKQQGLPVISIDNMQILNRCRHEEAVTGGRAVDFRIAKAAVKAKLPGAWHYLVTTFFFPPVRKRRTTLIPPILRSEVLSAPRQPGEHILVYKSFGEDLLPTLRSLPYPFRVYGTGRDAVEGNVTLCAFSETGFVDDLRTARGVVASAGFSLMGEAIHLRVPMLVVPFAGQFEQELNARYLARLGYGTWNATLDAAVIGRFIEDTPVYERALQSYVPRGNDILFTCIDELLLGIEHGEPRPKRLQAQALGAWNDA
jgi:uncharacterized protein (TIGR00661 family)